MNKLKNLIKLLVFFLTLTISCLDEISNGSIVLKFIKDKNLIFEKVNKDYMETPFQGNIKLKRKVGEIIVVRNEDALEKKIEGESDDGLSIYEPIKDQPINGNNYQYKIAKEIIKNQSKGIPGISCLYKGFISSTDNHGNLLIPCYEKEKKAILVFTKEILPIPFFGNIPNYFIPKNEEKTKWFSYEGVLKKNNKIFWDLKEIKPEDKKIAQNYIVVLVNPNKINFDSYQFETLLSENIILPTIKISNIDFLNLSGLFSIGALKYFKPPVLKKKAAAHDDEIHMAFLVG